MKRYDNECHSFVLGHTANIFVHGGVRRDGSEGLNRYTSHVLLEILKSVDYMVGLGLGPVQGRTARLSCAVDNKHGGGPARELDEVEDVYTNRGFLGGVRGFKEVNNCRDVSRGVDADQNSKFCIGFGSLD